jgi:NADPH2:quinone reductase
MLLLYPSGKWKKATAISSTCGITPQEPMRAAFYEKTGAPEVIQFGDLPRPTPKQSEVLVRVGAVALNPIDTYIRSGAVKMALPTPFIPGCDLAGTVEATGPGAHRFKPGDRVWGSNQGLLGRQGTFSEFAAVEEQWLYPTPTGIPDTEVVAAALVGITAHLGVFRSARLQPGETVFVNGGTGGVGSMVVQMSKAAGAHVITTVGSGEKALLCRSWGADCVLNYKTDDIPAEINKFTQGKGVDVWFETQREPNFVQAIELLARRGRLVLIAGRQAQPTFPVGPFYTRDLTLYGMAMFNASPEEQRRCAADINRWLGDKKLHAVIGRTFPLAEAAAAHRLQEENTIGKAGTLTGKIVLKP